MKLTSAERGRWKFRLGSLGLGVLAAGAVFGASLAVSDDLRLMYLVGVIVLFRGIILVLCSSLLAPCCNLRAPSFQVIVRTDRTSPPPYDPTFTSTFAWFMRVFMSGT